MVPLQHDTPGETAQPGRWVRDWRAGQCDPVPGVTIPNFVVVERDYPAVADKMAAIGPLLDRLGMTTKAVTYHPDEEIAYVAGRNGVLDRGAGAGRPAIDTDAKLAEAILALSATTNGRLAMQGFRELERRTGVRLTAGQDGTVAVFDKYLTWLKAQSWHQWTSTCAATVARIK